MTTKPTKKPAAKAAPKKAAQAGAKKEVSRPADRAPTGEKHDSAARIEEFCLAYHSQPNGKRAAILAGYAPSSAESTASRLLRTDKVKDRLRELASVHRAAAIADGKERREYLTKVLRGQVEDVAAGGKDFYWINTPTPVAERTKAAELLAKMDGDLAPIKVDVKLTEYTKDWLKDLLKIVGEYVKPEELREIARRAPRFDP